MDKPNLGYHFGQLHRLMLSLCKEDISKLGIQPSQTPFIATLLRADAPLTQDQLSNTLSIDKASTARSLDQLEKLGLVSRIINPDNRRQNLVTATQEARGISDQLFKILQKNSKMLVKDFSKTEMATLLTLINQMIVNGRNELSDRLKKRDRIP